MYCLFVNKNSRLTLNMYLLFNFLLIIKFAISLNLSMSIFGEFIIYLRF